LARIFRICSRPWAFLLFAGHGINDLESMGFQTNVHLNFGL
jgi:hypothetical protein